MKKHPDYAVTQRALAWFLKDDGRFSDAIIHFEKAIRLDPQNSWSYRGLGLTLLKMGRASDAVPPLLKAVEVDPQNSVIKDDLNQAIYSSDRETGAVSNLLATALSDSAGFGHFLEAVQSDTNHVILINNVAWSFATYPDPKLRNGKYAVRLATRACEMTGFKSTFCVGTLGVAYAEVSRFDEAVSSAQLACSLASAAGQTDILKKNQDFLELFRSHQPYHESVKATSP